MGWPLSQKQMEGTEREVESSVEFTLLLAYSERYILLLCDGARFSGSIYLWKSGLMSQIWSKLSTEPPR